MTTTHVQTRFVHAVCGRPARLQMVAALDVHRSRVACAAQCCKHILTSVKLRPLHIIAARRQSLRASLLSQAVYRLSAESAVTRAVPAQQRRHRPRHPCKFQNSLLRRCSSSAPLPSTPSPISPSSGTSRLPSGSWAGRTPQCVQPKSLSADYAHISMLLTAADYAHIASSDIAPAPANNAM